MDITNGKMITIILFFITFLVSSIECEEEKPLEYPYQDVHEALNKQLDLFVEAVLSKDAKAYNDFAAEDIKRQCWGEDVSVFLSPEEYPLTLEILSGGGTIFLREDGRDHAEIVIRYTNKKLGNPHYGVMHWIKEEGVWKFVVCPFGNLPFYPFEYVPPK